MADGLLAISRRVRNLIEINIADNGWQKINSLSFIVVMTRDIKNVDLLEILPNVSLDTYKISWGQKITSLEGAGLEVGGGGSLSRGEPRMLMVVFWHRHFSIEAGRGDELELSRDGE